MLSFDELFQKYRNAKHSQLTLQQLQELRDNLKQVCPEEINSLVKAQQFLCLLKTFRESIAEADKLHGENYPQLLNSLLSVGEDGLYSNNLRFIFELIQNVDDCEFPDPEDHSLTVHFDYSNDKIVLRYNEQGFTPFNVFAITGIAEAAKNVAAGKNEIGEKGIGFKSVFGVTNTVLIRSGWFSFELHKDNFTIPIANYQDESYCTGTEMTLFVPRGKAEHIYREIKKQYCSKEALFSRNPLLFLNKLTSLKMYFDCFRSMEFHVGRSPVPADSQFFKEENVCISVNLHDHENGADYNVEEDFQCIRYTHNVVFSDAACKSRYGKSTKVGSHGGKSMTLQAIFPKPEYISTVGKGALYSFLPTQLRFTVPVVCHVPFKLDASREFVDPQGNNLWFQNSCQYFTELLDYAYQDLAKSVKNEIVFYLPDLGENLFAKNNGKEKCLSIRKDLSKQHFCQLPIFYTTNEHLVPIDKIFCFDAEEKILEPVEACRLLSPQGELFLLPGGKHLPALGIRTERKIYQRLFFEAIHHPAKTADIVRYLNQADFHPRDTDFPDTPFSLTLEQVSLFMGSKPIADLFMNYSKKCLSDGKRPRFSVAAPSFISIQDALYEDFKPSEAPRIVERYLTWCKESSVLLDIDTEQYLPCYNSLVLSAGNPLTSFAAFCYAIDSRDTFSVRMKQHEISERLNQLSESDEGSAQDYLRELRNNRLMGRDAIGKRQYRNYIDLILQSGTSPERFIQELLQNADDCEYADGVVPEFSLVQKKNKITTRYNEKGFTRGNIRSITAIGESTKKLLLNQDASQIGEKGVGFKTIFAVASMVEIHSGAYHFSLSAQAPTIPESLGQNFEDETGTRMEITLKNGAISPAFHSERNVLELCLCLRKLKKLHINGTHVTIVDEDATRTITINNRSHKFRRFTYSFTLNDAALQERENGLRHISSRQQIICYIPEKIVAKDYPLYCGLPTNHRIKVPLVIDAPFMLTTSREEIETGSKCWNDQVRTALYTSVLSVLNQLRQGERYKILRFIRFNPRRYGSQTVYVNDMFDSAYLNNYDFLSSIQAAEILPTFTDNVFVSVNSLTAMRYPEAINILFHSGCFGIIPSSAALDIPKDDSLDSTLNALGCQIAPFSKYFPVLYKYSERYIENSNFRDSFYACLQQYAPESYQTLLQKLSIIPVYSRSGGSTVYVPWEEDSIFVKRGCRKSEDNYYILNEQILPKSVCEQILGVNINEMNAEWERSRYNDNLGNIINGNNLPEIYSYLLSEFHKGSFDKYHSWVFLMGMKDTLPLKNQLGDLTYSNLFICDEDTGYFQSELVRALSVHDECKRFADQLKYPSLSLIHYEDILYSEPLTTDDVEDLTDDYFINNEEILRSFYRNGQLPDELIQDYGLEYITLQGSLEEENYEFPEAPVRSLSRLRNHVHSMICDAPRIISVKVEQAVHKLQYSSGNTARPDDKNIRRETMSMYTPEGAHQCCFCQKCLKVKDYNFIEVNNIIANPRYYLPQMRVALCLECSKEFEAIRAKNSRNDGEDPFLKAIRDAQIGTAGFVDIPFGRNEHIRFTATHLAEIQEILRYMSQK